MALARLTRLTPVCSDEYRSLDENWLKPQRKVTVACVLDCDALFIADQNEGAHALAQSHLKSPRLFDLREGEGA